MNNNLKKCLKCNSQIPKDSKFCTNCGEAIDVIKGKCEYCNTKHNYLQEWYIVE